MDEYCGYDVEDVYSEAVLDEVMCEVCGTIQPVENKVCSYCGEKIQCKEAKKARKKNKKRSNESGDYVPARKKINRRPVEKTAAENTLEKPKPMAMPEPVDIPKPIEKPKPMAMPKPVEPPKPVEIPEHVGSFAQKLAEIHNSANLHEAAVETPKPVEIPEPIAMPEPVETPKPVDSFAQKLAEIHNSVEFPEPIVEKPADKPKPTDSFAQRLAEIHSLAELPPTIEEKTVALSESVENADISGRNSRQAVSINKSVEKPTPIINPQRPAKSISRQRRYDDDSPICAPIDEKMRDYVDSEDKEMKTFKKSFVIVIVILLVFFGGLLKSEKEYARNPVNFSTPVTQGIKGDYIFDCEDSSYLLIGRELPVGEYFLHCTEYGQGHIKVSNFDTCETIFTADFDKSFYVTLKEGDVLSFINCELYILKEPSGLNRPFGQPGMFKVGFDLEPGKYNVVPYGNDEEPVVRIHKDSKYDIDSFSDNAFPEKGKIKVKKGDYLELDNCILEQE